ncbi:hypothetical protein B4U79_11007, partial [Dinothrombium tinctorium]
MVENSMFKLRHHDHFLLAKKCPRRYYVRRLRSLFQSTRCFPSVDNE